MKCDFKIALALNCSTMKITSVDLIKTSHDRAVRSGGGGRSPLPPILIIVMVNPTEEEAY